MCQQVQYVAVGYHYSPLWDNIDSQYTNRWCLCAIRIYFHLPPVSGTTASSLCSCSLVEMSRIFGKRATVAYLHVLSLSSQSRRVITVYEFPLVLHASVHPRHSRYSSGAAYRGKVLTHTWKRKADLVSLTLRKQMVLFMSETSPSRYMKNYIVPSTRPFWEFGKKKQRWAVDTVHQSFDPKNVTWVHKLHWTMLMLLWNKLGRNLTDLRVFCMQHICTLSLTFLWQAKAPMTEWALFLPCVLCTEMLKPSGNDGFNWHLLKHQEALHFATQRIYVF